MSSILSYMEIHGPSWWGFVLLAIGLAGIVGAIPGVLTMIEEASS